MRMSVKDALVEILKLTDDKTERENELKRVGIRVSDFETLEGTKIKEQYAIKYIAETLINYPSLSRELAEIKPTTVFLSTSIGITKPVIREFGNMAVIYLNI